MVLFFDVWEEISEDAEDFGMLLFATLSTRAAGGTRTDDSEVLVGLDVVVNVSDFVVCFALESVTPVSATRGASGSL